MGGWVATGSPFNSVAWAGAYLFTKWHLDTSNRLPNCRNATLLRVGIRSAYGLFLSLKEGRSPPQ